MVPTVTSDSVPPFPCVSGLCTQEAQVSTGPGPPEMSASGEVLPKGIPRRRGPSPSQTRTPLVSREQGVEGQMGTSMN